MRIEDGIRASLPFRSVNRQGRPGYSPGLQRHHLLPRQLLARSAFSRMFYAVGTDRLGFHDFRRNGMLLPATDEDALRIGLPLHRGPHPRYNEMVLERAGAIEAAWSRSRGGRAAVVEAVMRFELLRRALRRRLLDPHRNAGTLNRQDPALDFTHLDRMADALWGASEPPL